MTRVIPGIHHVTAIAGDPQANIDFYTGILGLRLVKLTVNYDGPSTYHLYFGDKIGRPGTILTFFPWPGAPRGQKGSGQAVETSFSIPQDTIDYWTSRLKAHNVPFQRPIGRFEERVISFTDPDGLILELVSGANSPRERLWDHGTVPSEFAIRGFHHVTLSESQIDETERLLTKTMGFRSLGRERERYRFETGNGGPGALVDLLHQPGLSRGFVSVGTVHHVAWRTPNDEEQRAWRESIAAVGLNVTPVIDRKYFRSIYYRESGGVLFEIATEPPGFMVDQTVDELGTRLMLPSWLEPSRAEIEDDLPKISLPKPVPAR